MCIGKISLHVVGRPLAAAVCLSPTAQKSSSVVLDGPLFHPRTFRAEQAAAPTGLIQDFTAAQKSCCIRRGGYQPPLVFDAQRTKIFLRRRDRRPRRPDKPAPQFRLFSAPCRGDL